MHRFIWGHGLFLALRSGRILGAAYRFWGPKAPSTLTRFYSLHTFVWAALASCSEAAHSEQKGGTQGSKSDRRDEENGPRKHHTFAASHGSFARSALKPLARRRFVDFAHFWGSGRAVFINLHTFRGGGQRLSNRSRARAGRCFGAGFARGGGSAGAFYSGHRL